MNREADHQKMKQILAASVVKLCSSVMTFNVEVRIEGLIGITLDHSDVVLVSINETAGLCRSSPVQKVAGAPAEAANSSPMMDSNSGVHNEQSRHWSSSGAANRQQESNSLCLVVQPCLSGEAAAVIDKILATAMNGGSQANQWQESSASRSEVWRVCAYNIPIVTSNLGRKSRGACCLVTAST